MEDSSVRITVTSLDNVVHLGKELAKTVLEALDLDAKRQVLDDPEHIVRVRHVLEGIVGCLRNQGIPSGQSDLLRRELKAFAVELFIRRCRAARLADGEPNDSETDAANRKYFEEHYKSRNRR